MSTICRLTITYTHYNPFIYENVRKTKEITLPIEKVMDYIRNPYYYQIDVPTFTIGLATID